MSLLLSKVHNFGCPWHGLIKAGQLTLPNNATMPMRQPNGWTVEQGNTNLIALPTAPGAERTPEQQVEDALKGMQWLDKALLAGDQIHGTGIGEGCWIYHDSEGVNWHVSTQMQGVTGDSTGSRVTLKRFGVFGGEPETYEYTVDVVGVTATNNYFFRPANSSPLRLYSVHPQGLAAVFAVYVFFEAGEPPRPGSFIEVTLSGPGAACEVSLDVLYSPEQVYGAITYEGGIPFTENYGFNLSVVTSDTTTESFPDCSGTYRREATLVYDTFPGSFAFAAYPGGSASASTKWEGIIIGVLYKANGTKQTITATFEEATTFSATPIQELENTPEVDEYNVVSNATTCERQVVEQTQGVLRLRQSTDRNWQGSVRIYADDELILEESISQASTQTNELTRTYGNFEGAPPSGTVTSASWITTRSDGKSASYNGPARLAVNGQTIRLGTSDSNYIMRTSVTLSPDLTMGGGILSDPVRLGTTTLRLSRCSHAVFCTVLRLRDLTPYPEAVEFFPRIASPLGAVEVDGLTVVRASEDDPVPYPFASFNPLTGEAVRSFDGPVCWT